MSNIARALVIAAFAALPIRAAAAQLPAGTTSPDARELSRIGAVVKADIVPRGFPSVSIVVTRGGRTLLERAWGVANGINGPKAEPKS